MKRRRIRAWGATFLIFFISTAIPALAESPTSQPQAERFIPPSPGSPQRSRGYITLHYGRAFFTDKTLVSGFTAQGPGVELLSANIGFNWGRYLGLELAAEGYDAEVEAGGNKIGEYAFYSIIPQLRLGYPLLGDKLTPYLIAGAGLGFTEFNDATVFWLSTTPRFDVVNGSSVVYAFGGGLEYFIADNVALGLEAKYIGYDADFRINEATTSAGVNNLFLSAGLRLFFPGPPKKAVAGTPSSAWWAFDAKELRPYLGLRVGIPFIPDNQITPTFTLGEHERSQVVSGSLGFSLNQYLGVEIAVDQYGSDANAIPQGKVGEYDIWNFIPELRVRYPLMKGKLVPYLVAGVGATLSQSNDDTPLASADPSLRFSADDWSVAGAIGAGVEYFVAYNMAVGIESKYVFTDPEVQIGGVSTGFDLDSVLVTAGLRLFYP